MAPLQNYTPGLPVVSFRFTDEFRQQHPDIQQKLREEIIQARDDGTGKLRDLDYDEVMELPFLDAVCRETLRLYAPARFLQRL